MVFIPLYALFKPEIQVLLLCVDLYKIFKEADLYLCLVIGS